MASPKSDVAAGSDVPVEQRVNDVLAGYAHGFNNASPRTQEELDEIRSLFEYELSRDPVEPDPPPE
jgi:hypothetical protein